MSAAKARAEGSAKRSRWALAEGEEIVPGLSALKLLGGGLRYEAYLSWDETLRAMVVAKVVRPGLVTDESTLAAMARERGLLESLNHPVIVRCFGGAAEVERPHLLLEHLEGPRLSTLLRRYGPVQLEQALSLAIEVSAAIHYMAGRDLIHLDIKPSNLIMGSPPRVIDLSVARTLAEGERLSTPVGTDAYMAPEQALAPERGPVGPAADVWGLGATLHEALAGERPFPKGERSSDDPAIRFPQTVASPAPLQGVPGPVAAMVAACLETDPANRPLPGELGDRLIEALDAQPRSHLGSLKPRRR